MHRKLGWHSPPFLQRQMLPKTGRMGRPLVEHPIETLDSVSRDTANPLRVCLPRFAITSFCSLYIAQDKASLLIFTAWWILFLPSCKISIKGKNHKSLHSTWGNFQTPWEFFTCLSEMLKCGLHHPSANNFFSWNNIVENKLLAGLTTCSMENQTVMNYCLCFSSVEWNRNTHQLLWLAGLR